MLIPTILASISFCLSRDFRGISVEFPLHVTVVWDLFLVKGDVSSFCGFLDKGVGVESSEKLMKGLADPSSKLGIPRPKKQP